MSQRCRNHNDFTWFAKRYEDYHHVKYTDEAINAAANLSNRYIQDRFYQIKRLTC